MAISGIHVAMVSGMLVLLLRWSLVPRGWAGLITLPLIWFYTGATGWQPSALRAALMISVVILGYSLERPSNLVNSLCAAALMILAFDPQQIFGPSFQLSFTVVLSIALLLPRAENVLERWLQHDPMLPPDLLPWHKSLALASARWAAGAVSISAAAWLGSVPLILYYFHLANPVALLANVLIVPLAGVVLASTLGTLLLCSFFPLGAQVCRWLALVAMKCILWLSDSWAGFAWGSFHARPFSLLELVVYYVLLIGVITGWLLQKPRRWWTLGLVPFGCLVWVGFNGYGPSSSLITVFPLDGGMAVYSTASGKDVLIDCGKTNEVERLVGPLLQARGLNRLDGLVLTHGDSRHVGGAQAIAREFRTVKIYASPVKSRSPVYRQCVESFEKSGNLVRVSLGDRLAGWRVLHPPPGYRASRGDQNALVLAGDFDGTRVILLSDLDRAGQEAVMNSGEDLQAQIVVAGLPDQGEPLCDALIERISPALIIVADSERPSYEHAKPALIERLSRSGARVVCTSAAGVTTIVLRAHGKYEVRIARPSASEAPPLDSDEDSGS